jgi:hypothetical protein
MAVALAGRAAEEIVFNQATTSAAEDLEAVTAMARDMVMRLGMGRGLGARVSEFEALLARTPLTGDGRVLRFRPREPRQTEAAEAI